ncbi:SH3 domain-containing protein [Chloroflexi bacterium TSY]|nr:SH3 domain-containing protein [Chloroflexi bacterium TSY]
MAFVTLVVNNGCGAFFGPEETEDFTPTPTRVLVPTFTPTSTLAAHQATGEEEVQGTAAPDVMTLTEGSVELSDEDTSENTRVTQLSTQTPVQTPTQTKTPQHNGEELTLSSEPVAIVISEIVNVRQGPGTVYDIMGSVAANQQLKTIGRNQQGDWWQVCCFESEQPGWIYGPLLDVRHADSVPVSANIPLPPTPIPTPTAISVVEAPTPPPVEDAQPPAHSGTAGNFDPNAQFHIVHYRILGFGENNGGIFNNGGQHIIFVNVIDENGNGIDGAVVKDILADQLTVVTGNKGPGRTEFEMFWEPYKLYVASIPSGPVTSQVSNQMNTAKPHIPDIIGKLGPVDNEYAICPTPDDRCEPPFFHAHWSYEITFQKVR